MPWILGEVDDKIQAALGVDPLTSLHIQYLNCVSWVANEFLDALCSYEMLDCGIDKLTLEFFLDKCEPFSEEVVSRLA